MLLFLFILLQIADVEATWYGIKQGATEVNPLGSKMFQDLGYWPSVFLIKGIGLFLAIAATLFITNGWVFVAGLDVMGIGALVWNIIQIRKQLHG